MTETETDEALHKGLLAEELSEMPEQLSTGDFERFGLKLALHAIRHDSGASTGAISDTRALLSNPEVLALAIKEKIIAKLPDGYVSAERNPALVGPDYLYSFRVDVPRTVVMKATEDAGVVKWKKSPPGGQQDRRSRRIKRS